MVDYRNLYFITPLSLVIVKTISSWSNYFAKKNCFQNDLSFDSTLKFEAKWLKALVKNPGKKLKYTSGVHLSKSCIKVLWYEHCTKAMQSWVA